MAHNNAGPHFFTHFFGELTSHPSPSGPQGTIQRVTGHTTTNIKVLVNNIPIGFDNQFLNSLFFGYSHIKFGHW